MKKVYSLILMLGLVLVSFGQVTVTLNLDMTGTDYDESAEDLYYSGDVICPWGHESGLGWAEPGTKAELKFTDNGDGTFTLILDDINPGYYYMDFYRENEGGHGWGTNGEWSGAPLGIDQLLYVGYQDVVFNSKWGDYHDLTMHVDMNNVDGFDAATDTVYYLDGGYTRLHGIIMTDTDEDGIYTFTDDSIPQCYTRAIFGYGEINGDTVICEWPDEELDNRLTEMKSEDIEVTYVFGDPNPVKDVTPVTVTLNLDMTGTDYDESAEDLYYSGDVICPWGHESGLGWAEPGTKSELKFTDNGDGTYTLVLNDIDPGYYYMDFYRENEGGHGWGTNGEWSGAPLGIDQLLYVDGSSDVVFNSKWGDYHLLTLNVDMNGVPDFDAATDTVYYLDGGYTRLHGTIMTDDNADGIYTFVDDSIPQGYTRAVFGYGSIAKDIVTKEWSYHHLNNRVTLMGLADIEANYIFGVEGALTAIRKIDPVMIDLKMYPNPSNGIYNVELDGKYEIVLFDMTGRIVYSDVIDRKGTVNISNHAPGLYFARFKAGNITTTQKLILR